MEGGYVVTLGKNDHGQRGLGHCRLTENATIVTGIKDRYITVIFCADCVIYLNCELKTNFLQKIRCAPTYTVAYSDDNIITNWGTRSGVTNDNNGGVAQERQIIENSNRKVCVFVFKIKFSTKLCVALFTFHFRKVILNLVIVQQRLLIFWHQFISQS